MINYNTPHPAVTAVALERVIVPGVRGAFYQWRLSNGRARRACRADWLALGGGDETAVIPLAAGDAPPEEPGEREFADAMGW